jgi:Ser/Thr protein kinase RdoA (MazF antagonist)
VVTTLEALPESHREIAVSVLRDALGQAEVRALTAVPGGASGALTYRVDTDGRSFLLRMERGLNALQNPLHYACMKAAADAGIAPPLRCVDAARGIALMDVVTTRPLAEYPGGAPELVRALGSLARRLQDETAFPTQAITYRDLIGRMLGFVRDSRVFAPGLLEPHWRGFERIRDAYPWNDAAMVSSHNDPNPRNILFDGARLWLVDWETACANDPLTDLAVFSHELATTPELQRDMLRAWLGREPDEVTRAKLLLMQQLTRAFFACVLLRLFANDPNRAPDPDLRSLTPAEFVSAIQTGKLRLGTPPVLYEFGKMFLAGFLDGLSQPGFEPALSIVRA